RFSRSSTSKNPACLHIESTPIPSARMESEITQIGEVFRTAQLATNDFLARGGDGYGMLAGKTHVSADSGTRLVALDVIDYAEALKLIDAKVEGRIVFR
ncbi:MAG: hypothetical protein ACREDT_11535, partial [Methylocella sp.]